jgi:hypothetical protein
LLTSPRFRWNEQLLDAARKVTVLKRGSRGTGVHLLQFALLDLGHDMPRSTGQAMSPDGIFGPETQGAVKAFQRKAGLTDDGVVGDQTMAKLDAHFPKHGHEVRLHIRHLAIYPLQPFDVLLKSAQIAYDQYGIHIRYVSGQCLDLTRQQAEKFETIDGQCNWDIESGEFAELQKLGMPVPHNDVRVYVVNDIGMPHVEGCGGHAPGQPALTIIASSYRWSLPHEIGHVLLTQHFPERHWPHPENLIRLAGHSNNPTPIPVLSDRQVLAMRDSPYCRAI